MRQQMMDEEPGASLEDESATMDEDLQGFASIDEMMGFHTKQIAQLAEMHSELLELNERLQVGNANSAQVTYLDADRSTRVNQPMLTILHCARRRSNSTSGTPKSALWVGWFLPIPGVLRRVAWDSVRIAWLGR
jgi:hypothetical protein